MRSKAAAFLTAMAMLALLVPAAQATEVSVSLQPLSEPSVTQGDPFRFKVVITNGTNEAQFVGVSFDVKPNDPDAEAIPFDRFATSVPAGATVTGTREVVPSQWFAPLGSYQIIGRSHQPVAPLIFEVVQPRRVLPVFEDVTAAAGVATTHGYTSRCDSYSAGAAWGDIEGDGDLDLYLPHQVGAAQLFVNDGGHFTDSALAAGVDNGLSPGIAANFIDYDNDGDQDLYVVNRGANRLYQNDGTGHFVDVAVPAGVADNGPGSSASWTDYDNDGNVDLYVTNWATCTQGTRFNYTYAEDALFHNSGDGTFEDVTHLLHRTGITIGAGFQAAWFDYDNDGDQDLYLGNDYGGPTPKPNVMWRNDGLGTDGEWTFTNVSQESGTGIAINTMGIGIGDYDGDKDLDMALSNISKNVLLQNQGDGTFVDVADQARMSRPLQKAQDVSITWGLAFQDFNNDRIEDLYMAAGSLGIFEPKTNALMVGDGSGAFLDLSAPSGAQEEQGVSRGVAFADYDRDGWMDMYVINQGGDPHLFRNVTASPRGRWLEVDTIGTQSNSDGCGAKVIAVTRNRARYIRQVFCGSVSLGAGSDSTVHFGLKRARVLKALIVKWPSGVRQKLKDVPTSQLLRLVEPSA